MHHTTFREWLSRSPEQLFGVEDDIGQLSAEEKKERDLANYDKPIDNLSTSAVMAELVRIGAVNQKDPKRTWEDIVEYGSETGALSIDLSPLGSLRVNMRKRLTDLEGNKVWVLKKVVPLINDYDHGDRGQVEETEYAAQFHSELKRIDEDGLDSPQKDFKGMETLVLKMASTVRRNHPEVMHYEGLKKHTNDHYQIYFSYRGHGVEAPDAQRCEQFDIHMVYYPARGTVRCWGSEIISKTRRHQWYPSPSEWDEIFMPTQKSEEIVQSITEIFMTY